jgi:hypothetical protein
MLNAVTLESSGAAIVHMHRQGHRDGTLWKHQALAIVLIDAQVISDDLKLITRHSKYVVVVNTHEINSLAGPVGRQMQVAICAGQMKPSTPKPLVSQPRKPQHHKFDNRICNP